MTSVDSVDAGDEAACPNCGRVLAGAYCAGCGQKRATIDLTLKEFLHETTRELTHWDGKIPSTLKALFLKPGLLTQDFLEGRRARWLSPLKLYLVCSIAYFLSGPLVEGITHREGQEMANIVTTNPDGSKSFTPEMRKQVEAGWPARVFGMERLERAATNAPQLNREIEAVLPKAMFLLVPLFATLTRIVWGRRLPRYPAHLYLALHLHAAWFGALAFENVAGGIITWQVLAASIGVIVLAYIVWHGLLVVRRIFNESWTRTIVKSIAVGAVYSCFLFTLSLMMLGYVLMRM